MLESNFPIVYWLICYCALCCAVLSHSVMSVSLRSHGLHVAHQALLSMRILQARILEWVAMPSSKGIFPTQGSNLGIPHCRQILYCVKPLSLSVYICCCC